MRTVGIDLSLTSTGLAAAKDGVMGGVFRVKTTGKKTDVLAQRWQRLRHDILENVAVWVEDHMPDLVVIESPSYGSQHGSQHDRSGLWWLVVEDMFAQGIPVATVTPQGRAKYGTGKGNAGKDEVLAAVVKRYMGVDVTGNDIADAVLLAAMGQRHLGTPVEVGLPAVNLLAMDGAAWPDRLHTIEGDVRI